MEKVRPLILAEIRVELETFGLVLLTLALFGLGGWLIWWAKKWRDQMLEDEPSEINLETYRQMMEDGEMAPEEFAKIRERFEQRQHGITAEPPISPPQHSSPDSEAIQRRPSDRDS